MEYKKHKALEVAKWFLLENKLKMLDEDADPITNLKLQKLLYYAQGCFLGLTGNILFDENIEAWKHGPVVPIVYEKFKQYGSNPIDVDNYDLTKVYDEFNPSESSILRDVYSEFGKYSAWGLRNMTHQESPWRDTALNEVIPVNKIKTYFLENYVED